MKGIQADYDIFPNLKRHILSGNLTIERWHKFNQFYSNLNANFGNSLKTPPNDLNLVRKNTLRALCETPKEYVKAVTKLGTMNEMELFLKHGIDYGDEFHQIIDQFKREYGDFKLTDSEIYAIFGYTSNFFYYDLNNWLK